ncbi:(2R)-3-sulfolactate dehydrogenase (NADP+) [Nitrospirillum amazonense]|uniref:(2R)-3-sulfolactate dehydrogenase (NADP+) n=1 Tax=Nitrospirillum amazonense TaxID=28077 RepID=A0A560JF25_9PROT|nr:Ldh family oxidoreductase [Nitrospirillum amazonense]TWB69808.1 (2R)-3-sulfolactate dehydrogenase (NADP+) [Nitrospirillum amazonense]
MPILSLTDAHTLTVRALTACGTLPAAAGSVARALVAAEADGQAGHGLARVPSYAAQVRAGKVDGAALPRLIQTAAASLRVDAAGGFAYPAVDMAVDAVAALARQMGTAGAGIHASHHIGQAGLVVERLADQGMVALVMSNTPAAMATAGGRRALLGTNPLAFAAPVAGRAPLVIDMALSLVARSKIVAAQKAGRPIPADWAVDADGNPTTDPAAALKGALAPIGGPKGAALALMVEILCGALAGGRYGWQASSFLDAQGSSPAVGQVIIAFDPAAFRGPDFAGRMGELVQAIVADGARLPGDRRLAARARAQTHGLEVPLALLEELKALAAGG